MSITQQKKTQLATIISGQRVQEMIVLEPDILTILEIAADPEPRENRWIAYSALKRMMKHMVGWDARQSELRSSRYYDVMIDAIDALLPENEGGI